MDCVRTALCAMARVTSPAICRDEANMPGSKKEVKNAREEANFEFNVQPVALELNEQGHVCGFVSCVRVLASRMPRGVGVQYRWKAVNLSCQPTR